MFHAPALQATLIRRSGEAAVALALATLLWASAARAQAPLEYQVKASYLYNFMQFVEWPVDALAASARFNVCVVGLGRFGRALAPLEDERVQGRQVAVRALERAADARTGVCHILFVAGGKSAEAPPLQGGMLTVGETPGFLARGGMINLVEVRGRIRFEVNAEAAERAGLTVSSRLLRLALNAP